MHKTSTLVLAAALAAATLSAQAQITLDGVINGTEIGTGGTKYTSLGAFTTPHVGTAGFGLRGLLQLYGANSSTKLYVALAGSLEGSANNFQLYLDLPGKTGVPIGTPLPAITSATTVLGANADPTKAGNTIAGTKLDVEADVIIALTGQGNLQAAVYKSATNGMAGSLATGVATDGTPTTVASTAATGDYALFTNTRVAYKAPSGDITTNPGNANGGGAGSYGVEYEFDKTAMGLPSGASIVHLMAAYVSPDGYFSSDVIPEIPGNGNNNLGFQPDFTALAGTQSATLNLVVLSTRRADEAVVAMSVFPNPSEGISTVSYQVADAAQAVSVRITDLLGRNVRTVLDAKQSPGFHDLAVATSDLSLGTYLVKVQVGDKIATRRLAVTR